MEIISCVGLGVKVGMVVEVAMGIDV